MKTNPDVPSRSLPWRVGDRIWTGHHGTGTVLRLRERAPRPEPSPDALVEFALPTPWRQWMILTNVVRLADAEPARLPDGLMTADIGQAVWHTRFGQGTVRGLSPSQPPVADIEFADGTQRQIMLGGGHLRATPPDTLLHVEFEQWAANAIGMTLRCGLHSFVVDIENLGRPFEDLLNWLEAASCGVHQCAVALIDVAGWRVLEVCDEREGGATWLRINTGFNGAGHQGDLLFEIKLNRRQLVAAMYEAFLEFAASPRFWQRQWESISHDGPNAPVSLPDLRSDRLAQWLAQKDPVAP